MSEMKHLKKEDLSLEHKEGTSDYEYYKRSFLPRGYAEQCIVNIYVMISIKINIYQHFC